MNTRVGCVLRLTLIVAVTLMVSLAIHRTPAIAKKNEIVALYKLYKERKKDRDYVKAEEIANRMRDIIADQFGKDHKKYESILGLLSRFYNEQGKYTEALPYYEEMLQIREKRLGRSHLKTAVVLIDLANVHTNQGRYAQAISLYKRALEIREQKLGSTHVDVASVLNNLGVVYRINGRYVDSIAMYKRTLEIREKKRGKTDPSVGKTLMNLGVVYHDQGRYKEAITVYKRALEIHKRKNGARNTSYAKVLDNLGRVYRKQGRYTEAKSYHKEALQILEKNLGRKHPTVAVTLTNLALINEIQGRYTEAISLNKRILQIWEKRLGYTHPKVALVLNNMAIAFRKVGRYADAVQLYKRALQIREKKLGPNHPDVAGTMMNLAIAYEKLGQSAEAIAFYERALEIKEKTLGRSHPDVARALTNLADAHRKQGRYEAAISMSTRAARIIEEKLGSAHPGLAVINNNLAIAYEIQGQGVKALGLYEHALKIKEKTLGRTHPSVASTLNNLAILYRKQGRHTEAFAAIRRAAKLLSENQLRSGNAYAAETSERNQPLRQINGHFVKFSYGYAKEDQVQRSSIADEALAAAQRASTSSVSTALSQMAARLGGANQSIGNLVREQQDLGSRWQSLNKKWIKAVSAPLRKRNQMTETRLRQELRTAEELMKNLSIRLQKEFPQFSELTNPKPLAVADVQRLLGPGEALVSYLVLDDSTFVWAISKNRIQWRKLAKPLTGNALAERVSNLRKSLNTEALETGDGEIFDLEKAHQLYKVLLGPVEDLIRDKKKLLIVPSGPLTSLPFQVLVTEKPAEAVPTAIAGYRDAAWLVKRYAVTILPSISSLRALRVFARGRRAQDAFIGYGNPDFGKGKSGAVRGNEVASLKTRGFSRFYTREGLVDVDILGAGLRPLPDTEDELKQVARKLGVPKSQIRLQSTATEKNVKETKLDAYRVVYFATHGLVAGDYQKLGSKATEPALALTIPTNPTKLDDGLLTASEVAQLKLNADWVILSACNTAAGEKPGAEALSGLAKAFIYAGARSLLVSHWPVVSSAAVRLTTGIFDAQAKNHNIGKAEALRRSMLELMNDTRNPANAYPVIWAPFIVVGEGG